MPRLLLAAALLLLACDPEPNADAGAPDAGTPDASTPDAGTPDAGRYPSADQLPEDDALPDPFTTFFDGRTITTADEWRTIRAPELVELFSHYVYGFAPPPPDGITATEVARDDAIAPGVAYREVELVFGPDGTPPIHLAIFTPSGATAPVPVFLALNKCGNQSVIAATSVRVTATWIDSACTLDPGGRADSWPIADIVARGWAVATFHESDVDPDDASDRRFADGIHPHYALEGVDRWGTIAAWSFGLSRAVDHLVTAEGIDASTIVTVGHSRRGKAALWAAALDPRIAMTIPHQSGTGGATLSRSYLGESVAVVNTVFPHWFDDVFPTFADRENRLPIDQHLLLALVAPRPLLSTSGDDDTWADPPGAQRAVEAAAPVYALLGAPDAIEWRSRPGDHALTAADWTIFMDFADAHRP